MLSASGERCETGRQATTTPARMDGTHRGELEQSSEGLGNWHRPACYAASAQTAEIIGQ